ncbi:biotin transporter BioY [Natronosalvus vescus]|uniref:biotin transporter BioY n=1 Tax=Natronosalvus vescus TaxID=2953881 RepID=UPI002091D075|nr:biotin transporter BioY [Natronosalvus vescus]
MATSTNSVNLVDGDVAQSFARAAVLAALISATAYVSIPIPFSPVPFTLQVLFVCLAGLALGPVWGPVSMLLYVTAGAVGLPVFANGAGGLGVIAGPTGGYLLSYPIAAFVIGLFVHRGTTLRDPATVSLPTLVVSVVAGLVLVYGIGVPWFGWVQNVGMAEAVVVAMVPYLPFDLVKLAAAIAIVRSGRLSIGN